MLKMQKIVRKSVVPRFWTGGEKRERNLCDLPEPHWGANLKVDTDGFLRLVFLLQFRTYAEKKLKFWPNRKKSKFIPEGLRYWAGKLEIEVFF